MAGNIKPSSNNMWQTSPVDGLTEPPQLDNIVVNGPTGPTGPTGPAGGGGGSANTGTSADKIVLPPVKWVAVQPFSAITGYFGGGYSYTSETGKLNSDLNVPLSDYVHEIAGNLGSPSKISEGLNGGPTAFAAGPQLGDRVLFCDQYADQYQFIYTITALGETDVSGWELTATNDINNNTFSEWLAYIVAVEETPIYAESSVNSIHDIDNLSYGWNLNLDNSRAYGHIAMAMGTSSIALGQYAEASGNYSVSIGENTFARGDWSTAVGVNARANNQFSTVIGREAVDWVTGQTVVGSATGGTVIVQMIHAERTENFTVTAYHFGRFIPCSKSTQLDVEVPINGTFVPSPIGVRIQFGQVGSGAISIGGPITVIGKSITTGVGDVLTIVCTGLNTWWGF